MGIFDQQQNPFALSPRSLAPIQTGTVFDPLIALSSQIRSQQNDRLLAEQATQAKQAGIEREDLLIGQRFEQQQTLQEDRQAEARDRAISLAGSTKELEILKRQTKLEDAKVQHKRNIEVAGVRATTRENAANVREGSRIRREEAKLAAEGRRTRKSLLLKELPSPKDNANAIASIAANKEANILMDEIVGKLSFSTTGFIGWLRGGLEAVSGVIKPDLIDPDVTRIKDKSAILLSTIRRALAGVGVSSDRDTKDAVKIISSIDWSGREETIREKLADLRDFINAKVKAAEAIREAHTSSKQGLKDLAAEAVESKPPAKGARKAPDGKWYIERNGKFFEVTR